MDMNAAERQDRMEFHLCISCIVFDQSQSSIFHVIITLHALIMGVAGDHIVIWMMRR